MFAHFDGIVAEKTADSALSLERDGLDIYRDGDYIRARGTTLGADDGVAVAYARAVLDGAVEAHPNFEALFTSDEEIGLCGAEAFDGSTLRARQLINIDSDEEGVFTVGCAGGMQVNVALPIRRERKPGYSYRLKVSGLVGGHSGIDIGRGRENATRILAEALSELGNIHICEISGGTKDNAIPRSAECVFISDEEIGPGACQVFDAIGAKYAECEPNIRFELSPAETASLPLSSDFSACVISLITSLPNGVVKMSEDLPDDIETSLNLGITELGVDELSLSFYLRSSRGGAVEELCEKMKAIAQNHGASAVICSSYPAWEYDPVSPLRERAVALYTELYGKTPVVNTIHAGLECGILAAKVEGLDCISMGPDNYCLHTTEEHLSLASFCRVWDFLTELLKRI